MENLSGCQIPCLPKISEGEAKYGHQPFDKTVKRLLAKPWNYYVKKYLKRGLTYFSTRTANNHVKRSEIISEGEKILNNHLNVGDWVRVKPLADIQSSLNRFKELKGCAFLEDMQQYCDSEQRVLKVMERFLDERDYQVKKTSGIVLLENVFCQGTPVFGRCDRSCLLFWREEWLEKITE